MCQGRVHGIVGYIAESSASPVQEARAVHNQGGSK